MASFRDMSLLIKKKKKGSLYGFKTLFSRTQNSVFSHISLVSQHLLCLKHSHNASCSCCSTGHLLFFFLFARKSPAELDQCSRSRGWKHEKKLLGQSNCSNATWFNKSNNIKRIWGLQAAVVWIIYHVCKRSMRGPWASQQALLIWAVKLLGTSNY